jgi:hypothetical protein
MSNGYKLTQLADTQPGMVLSDVLLDRLGHMLLPKGAVLTEASIASLGRHGVGMLPVVSGDAPSPPDAPALQARLDHLFRGNERDNEADWATGILRRFIEDYRLEREVAP